MERTVTTRGVGQASGTPDAMKIGVAVAVRGRSVSDALAGTATGVRAVGEVARAFTTDERITSTGLNVWPAHDNDGRQSGYECRHQLSIYCVDLEKAGELVTALGDLGRVLIEGVQPVIADPSTLAVTARQRAWDDALSKAEELARLADASLGGVLTIAEEGQSHQPFEARDMLAAKQDSTSFEAGSQVVSASLTVSWSLG
ncbi:MAG TPA: SIMPL domain-containing protein [Nocardioidaceae bacterium]|nr:SIMPL domain-containing protein [Nocardioidaceae bacterium]